MIAEWYMILKNNRRKSILDYSLMYYFLLSSEAYKYTNIVIHDIIIICNTIIRL